MATATKRSARQLDQMSPETNRAKLGQKLDALIALANMQANMVISLLTAAVAIATTASKVKTVAAITYVVDGVRCVKAATDNFWTLTGSDLADGKTRKYLLLIDAAGAASVLGSTDQLTAAAAACVFPTVPAGKIPIGLLQVDTVGAAFVPGTTLLSAGTVTDTYTDLVQPPAGVVLAGSITPLP